MPDANKFAKLREIGYRIPATCGMCPDGKFPGPAATWGECQRHRYSHVKHDNPAEGRGVSIFRGGTCQSVQTDGASRAILGAHAEFLDASDGGTA